jgi:AAA+ superfamily predicted ATPase
MKGIKLKDLLAKKFQDAGQGKTVSTFDFLDTIYNRVFKEATNIFDTYIFLDCDSYINDRQVIRKIKDIVTRYQSDTEYTVNMIFLSQTVCVPSLLERLSEVIYFDLPNEEQLRKLSDHMAEEDQLNIPKPPDEVVHNLKGLTLFEVEQAYVQSWQMYQDVNLDFIRNFKKSAIAKTDLLSLLESNITFDDIGGMETLKKWITKSYGGWTVEGRKFGLPMLKGLLMVGLPGCGKSLTAKALGNIWKLPVISFDPGKVFSSRVGESEHNIRRVLKIVENIAPCVLMIDEIEKAFAGSHSSTFSDSGVTARVIGSFLNWMQDSTAPVFTIATSNNIQYLPPEMIQRFDEKFFVNLPQHEERIEIFRIHLKKVERNPEKFDLEALARESKDLSGREIEQTLREAMYDAFHSKCELETRIILNVLSKKTNLLTTMSEQLQYLLEWVGWNEDKNDGIRARFASVPDNLDMKRVKSEIESLCKNIEKKKPFDDFDKPTVK